MRKKGEACMRSETGALLHVGYSGGKNDSPKKTVEREGRERFTLGQGGKSERDLAVENTSVTDQQGGLGEGTGEKDNGISREPGRILP